jgi:hypothetical protein
MVAVLRGWQGVLLFRLPVRFSEGAAGAVQGGEMTTDLFDMPESVKPVETHAGTGRRCNECRHGQGWVCGSKIIWYCWRRKSNRTDNGLLKIKARQAACEVFEARGAQ